MASPDRIQSRINNRWPVAKDGLPFILTGSALTFIFLYACLLIFAWVMGLLTLFTIYFFRDPGRENGSHGKAVLTPADGKILGIQDLKNSENLLGEPAKKISIFMSIFDVHVNRIPVSGKILDTLYHPGRFLSANLDKASEENESNRITLETDDGQRIIIVQIAGLIARRIACWIKEGDEVKAGQRFGLIRFGSRLDVYLPADSQVIVQPRHKVKAGITILGYLS
ncbi:MAG: phosphatidylserine decarboxylase family protein [Pseudomonadota bacterium]